MIGFANPFTSGQKIAERDRRIAQLEAEAAEAEKRECDVFLAYTIEKRLRDWRDKEQDQ